MRNGGRCNAESQEIGYNWFANIEGIPKGLKYFGELNMASNVEGFWDKVIANEDRIEGKDFYKVLDIPFISYSK